MPRILLTQAIHEQAQEQLGRLAELVVAPDTSPSTLSRCAQGCDVVVVRAPLPDDIFVNAPSLVGAVRHGAGLDMIPIDAATAAGVLVANVPGANANAVAEHVLASMLRLSRCSVQVAAALNASRSSAWAQARMQAEQGRELRGRTAGLIGYGRVGQSLASICARGFGMTVLVHSRTRRAATPDVDWTSLEELLARSDFVVLTCPLTPQTRALIDAPRLQLMRPDAFLINAARGAVVVEQALLEALRSGRLAGAALDVFDHQPVPDDHPFWSMPEVLLTPHVAGISAQSMTAIGHGVVVAVEHLLRGVPPPHCVNPEALPRFETRVAGLRNQARDKAPGSLPQS